MLLLSKLKLWGVAALAAIAAIAATFAKLYKAQRDRARERAERAEAQLDWKRETEAADQEIESEYSELRERLKADMKAGKVPENLERPNDW
jgi:uncharacterized protein YecT (DUF1311 family)